MVSDHDLLPLWLGSRRGVTPIQTSTTRTFQSISFSHWKWINVLSGVSLGLTGTFTLVSLSQADFCILTRWLSVQTSSPRRCQGLQFPVSHMISALSGWHCDMSCWGYRSRTRHCPCLWGVCSLVGKEAQIHKMNFRIIQDKTWSDAKWNTSKWRWRGKPQPKNGVPVVVRGREHHCLEIFPLALPIETGRREVGCHAGKGLAQRWKRGSEERCKAQVPLLSQGQ